jgi:hypothetical protein
MPETKRSRRYFVRHILFQLYTLLNKKRTVRWKKVEPFCPMPPGSGLSVRVTHFLSCKSSGLQSKHPPFPSLHRAVGVGEYWLFSSNSIGFGYGLEQWGLGLINQTTRLCKILVPIEMKACMTE